MQKVLAEIKYPQINQMLALYNRWGLILHKEFKSKAKKAMDAMLKLNSTEK